MHTPIIRLPPTARLLATCVLASSCCTVLTGNVQPYGYPPAYPPPPGYPAYSQYSQHPAAPYGYPAPGAYYAAPSGAYPYPPPGQLLQPQPRPLNVLAAAAASGLHEMERERELKEKAAGGDRSHPGSASSTPYGSYDQGGASHWPGYSAVPYPAHLAAPTSAAVAEEGPPPSNSRSTRRHLHAHPHLNHPSLHINDDAATRHSHSHDPSHPAHHVSLSRTQHRHAFTPYGYGTSSADHSLANSPASSAAGSDSEGEEGIERGGSRTSRRVVRGSMPHHPTAPGAHDRLGQLHQALQGGLPPSTSPVLGPLKGLTLMSAAASRVGSRVHSRATSPVQNAALLSPPIHLPPLKLPPNLQTVANGVGMGMRREGLSSGGSSANTSGATSGTGSPETASLLLMKGMSGLHELGTHHHQLASMRLQHRPHPYSHPTPPNRSQPGSPTAFEFADRGNLSNARGATNDGGLSPPGPLRRISNGAIAPGSIGQATPSSMFYPQPPPTSEAEKHTIRDILNGTIGVGADHAGERTLPPLSSLAGSSASAYQRGAVGASSSSYFPPTLSGTSSRHNSPPGSPSQPGSHFSSNGASTHGSSDSLASLIHAAGSVGGGSGVGGMGTTFSRRGFGMTPLNSSAPSSLPRSSRQASPLAPTSHTTSPYNSRPSSLTNTVSYFPAEKFSAAANALYVPAAVVMDHQPTPSRSPSADPEHAEAMEL